MKHRGWIAFSGFVWLFVGIFLTYKGIRYLSLSGNEKNATLFLAIGLIIGHFKGRYVLSKTVQRIVTRIRSLSLPIQAGSVYPRSYWLLMGSMIGLGILLRFLPIPTAVHGLIDVAIGSALVNGAMLYFRESRKREAPVQG